MVSGPGAPAFLSLLDVVGKELLRPIHDQVSQLDHGHEVRVQLAASVVDAVRHLALRGDYIGVIRLPRKLHGLRQVIRSKDIGIHAFDLKNGVQVLECPGALELAHHEHIGVGLPHVLGALAARHVEQRDVIVIVAPATAPTTLTVGPKQARVDEHLGLCRGFDVRSHNAGDAAIEKQIDGRAADIRHPCGHGEPKAIGDAAHLVNRLRREQPVFAVQVDKIEAAEHADDLDGLGTWINQAKTETLLALLVFLKYLVRSEAHDGFLITLC